MGVEAALIGGGLGLIGSSMAGSAAKSAANTSAQAQLEAARIAASSGAFRPVGMTTRFGTSNFQMGTDQYGNPIVTGAGYTASPEIQALQDRLSALYGTSLGQAEQAQQYLPQLQGAAAGLFGLGQQFLPTGTTPTLTGAEQQYQNYLQQLGTGLIPSGTGAPSDVQAYQQQLQNLSQQIIPTSYDTGARAQQLYSQQQALLDPTRQQEEQRLSAGVFGRGRAGLNISGQGQPELYALAKAREQQNAALAVGAQEQARQQLQQDIGLGTGLSGQAIQAGQQGQLYNLGLAQQGLGMLGQGLTVDEAARQRMLQNITTGAGLFGSGAGLVGTGYGLQTQALSPFQTQFGVTQALESAAQQPLELGANIGGRNVNTAGANALLQGGLGAAQTQLQGALVGPSAMANNLSSFGQQYMQNQQQQQLLRQLGLTSIYNQPYTAANPLGMPSNMLGLGYGNIEGGQ